MKRFLIILKIFLVSVILITTQPSCTKLDEEVYSDLTADKFFADPDNLIYAFGLAYTKLYHLVGHKYGMIGSEVGTDMLIVPQRGGDWFDGGEWLRWHRLSYASTESYFNHWWVNIYSGVNICNQLLLQFETIEDVDTRPAVAELRALRALYYYWLIDKYGNVPIVDSFDVPADYKPATNTRKEVYDFIEKELTEAMPFLSKETGLQYYGRINYYTAQMILAKLYLNAEVFTDVAQWDKAFAHCDTVLNGPYNLETDYFANFRADATISREHIMGVPFDQINAQGFEIHLFTLHYNLQNKFGLLSATWNGICFQEGFFNYFEETDVRRNGLLNGFQLDAEGNQIEDPNYEKFDPTNPTKPKDPDGAPLNLTPYVIQLEPNCLRQSGARVAKFSFIDGSDRYTSNDFPVFRLADAMLMMAEILLHQGDAGTALSLVNEVRSRAGVDPLPDLTFDNLLEERGRELYAEGYRRSDMIRFGKFLDARWEKPDVSPEYTKLWAIPQAQVEANPNLIQNTGY